MRKYVDYHNREVQIGDQVIQLYDGTIGEIQSFTKGGNPRITPWNTILKEFQDIIFPITGRWCLLLPVK